MLEQMWFRNFKAWEEALVVFGRVTGIFGTNSSGKTSLLQFLLLLKQTKESQDRSLTLELGGPYVHLGSYSDWIHNHDTTKNFGWQLVWTQGEPIQLFDTTKSRTHILEEGHTAIITAQTTMSETGEPRPVVLSYAMSGQSYRLRAGEKEPSQFALTAPRIDDKKSDFKFKRTPGRPWHLPGPVKSYAFPDQVQTYYQNTGFLSTFVSSFEKQMDRVFHLGPLRDNPRREYTWTRSRPSGVGARGERAIEAILSATEHKVRRNIRPKTKLRPFQEVIAYWLREMGLVHSFTVQELRSGSGVYQALVRVSKSSPEVLLTDVGFGVSQVLPVLTLLYAVDEGSTVILEQPEIHLHPLAQAALADAILSVAMYRNVQVIVESHSEHFLLRLQTRIAEGEATPTDVRLYFCDTESEQKLVPLELDLLGKINNWPKDFFGDAFGETAAAQKARLKRAEDPA